MCVDLDTLEDTNITNEYGGIWVTYAFGTGASAQPVSNIANPASGGTNTSARVLQFGGAGGTTDGSVGWGTQEN